MMLKPFRMFGRSFRDAFKSVIRNFSLSLASISCISITLIIVAVSIMMTFNVNNFSKEIKEDVTIVVFINDEVEEKDMKKIEARLNQIGNVLKVTYQSKEDIKEEMSAISNEIRQILESYSEDESPLLSTFQVTVKDLKEINKTAETIKNFDEVFAVNYGEAMVNKVIGAFDIIQKVTVVAVIALVVVTVFLVINTIKLTIFSRKREISIMRLVGASNFTIKMPFIIEGMVLGLFGSIVPIIMVIYGYFALYNHFDGQIFSPLIRLVQPEPFIYLVALSIVLLGIVVGMIGSLRAVRKYLKI